VEVDATTRVVLAQIQRSSGKRMESFIANPTLSTSNMSDSTHPENENFDELFPESSHSQKAFWQRIKTTLESQQAAISQQQEINASQQAMLTRVDSLLAAQETLINPPAPIPLMEDPYIDIHPYRVETKVALAVFREEYQALICFIQKPIPSDIAVTFGNIRTMQSTRRTFSTMDEIKAALGAWSAIAISSLMIPNYASRQTLSDAEQNELNRDYSKLKNGIKKLYEYLLHLCESSNIIQMVAYFDAVQTVCCLRRIETDVMLGADVFISGQVTVPDYPVTSATDSTASRQTQASISTQVLSSKSTHPPWHQHWP